MWLRNKATGGEFYVTNEAHQRRLLDDPAYEVFEPAKKGKKAKKEPETPADGE